MTSLNGLGDIYYDLKRLDDAKQAYEQAMTRLLQLAETAGEPTRFQTMLQKLSEIESLKPLNYIDVVDVAAAYVLLLKSGVDEKYRQPLLEALSQGREMEREQFIQVRNEPEFIDLQDFPGLVAALQAN